MRTLQRRFAMAGLLFGLAGFGAGLASGIGLGCSVLPGPTAQTGAGGGGAPGVFQALVDGMPAFGWMTAERADGPGQARLAGGRVLHLSGVITPALAQQVMQIPSGSYEIVVLNSIGGDVRAAIDIGRMFRRTGVRTHVGGQGHCYSACTILFQSGTERTAHAQAAFFYHYASQASDDQSVAMRGSVWGTVQLIEALIEFDADPIIYDQLPGIGGWELSPAQSQTLNIVQHIVEDPVS